MTEKVPALTIVGMAATLLIAFGITISSFFIWKKKSGAKITPFLIGAGTFVAFALILERILHFIINTVLGEALTANIWLYALYGGLAAALFEETGRFISMKFFMKKTLSKQNAVMFGIGHGGAEAVILIGLTYISNLITSVMINTGLLETALSQVSEPLRSQTLDQLSPLWTAPSYQFFLAGIERVFSFALQICLSYLVYRAVKEKKFSFYLIAFALHFVIDAGIVLLAKVLPTIALEGVLAAVVTVLCVIICITYRKEKEPSPADRSPADAA